METFGLIFKVLWAPGEALHFISKKPRILLPLIVLSALSLGAGLVSLSKIDFGDVALRQLEQSGRANNMSEEQKQGAVRISRRLAPVFVAVGALSPVILITIATAIYFGLFSMVGREGNFKTFYALTLFAYVPLILRQLVAVVQLLAVPAAELDVNDLGAMNLAIFLDRTTVSRFVYAFASVVDICSIWIMILLIIGYKFVLRKSVSTGLRAAVVVAVYLFFSLLTVGLRMLQTG